MCADSQETAVLGISVFERFDADYENAAETVEWIRSAILHNVMAPAWFWIRSQNPRKNHRSPSVNKELNDLDLFTHVDKPWKLERNSTTKSDCHEASSLAHGQFSRRSG